MNLGLARQAKDPGVGAYLPGQSAADVLREAAGADCAFLAAAYVNPSYDPKNLASLIQFPTEKISVLNLSGVEIKRALERSVSLYPQPNVSFLQVSGFSIEFRGSGPAAGRILGVSCNGSPLDDSKTYSVAMPSGLAMGSLGYFKIWDKSKIAKTLDTTVEQALEGKPYAQTSPRWVLRSS